MPPERRQQRRALESSERPRVERRRPRIYERQVGATLARGRQRGRGLTACRNVGRAHLAREIDRQCLCRRRARIAIEVVGVAQCLVALPQAERESRRDIMTHLRRHTFMNTDPRTWRHDLTRGRGSRDINQCVARTHELLARGGHEGEREKEATILGSPRGKRCLRRVELRERCGLPPARESKVGEGDVGERSNLRTAPRVGRDSGEPLRAGEVADVDGDAPCREQRPEMHRSLQASDDAVLLGGIVNCKRAERANGELHQIGGVVAKLALDKRVDFRPVPFPSGDLRQVNQRAPITGVSAQHALPRRPRLGRQSSAGPVVMEEDFAEASPRLDIVG